jgi:hypothetical protein
MRPLQINPVFLPLAVLQDKIKRDRLFLRFPAFFPISRTENFHILSCG